MLVAIGRSPRTMDLGLGTIGLTDGEWLDVDDTMLVNGYDWLYGVGDVNHRALLTHQGKYQARAAGDVIAARARGDRIQDAMWGRHVASADAQAVPQVTFTDPEVASVGLTAEAAAKTGRSIRVIDYDLSWLAGATVYADGYQGQARAIVDEERQVLLGVTFVGPDVSEMLQAATIAVVGEVPLSRLWHAVPAYPTVERGLAALPRGLRPRGVRVKALPDSSRSAGTAPERFFAAIDRGVLSLPACAGCALALVRRDSTGPGQDLRPEQTADPRKIWRALRPALNASRYAAPRRLARVDLFHELSPFLCTASSRGLKSTRETQKPFDSPIEDSSRRNGVQEHERQRFGPDQVAYLRRRRGEGVMHGARDNLWLCGKARRLRGHAGN